MEIIDEFRLAAAVPNYFKTISDLKDDLPRYIWRAHKAYSRESWHSYGLHLSGSNTRSAILDMLTPNFKLGN
jgi:hypothetical protein